ncbi:MAG TPA: gliding motility-associated C-terminal domain-containing protein, partial [Saprospiraceae bacterium]|nr:gliding motility-associated C-terminal domain-containing protein [Saprospiraceae bacterium]
YINNGGKITCGNYGDEVKVGKNRTFVVGPGSTNQPKGCDTMVLDYKIIPMNSGYVNTNPAEHRPSVAIDSVTFDYEPFLLNGFTQVKVQASIIDHPVMGNSYFDVGSLDNSGHFVATFDTLTQFPSLLKITDYAIAIRFLGIPQCESNTGSFNGDNIYDFDANIFYKRNYHSFNYSGGACVIDTTYNNNTNITYSNPPEISLENLGPPTSEAVGDVFTWTIRQCNTTNYADANVSWVSIENLSTAINILSIDDISDPLNVQALTVNNIPAGGYIAMTNGLLRAVATNTPNDICNVLKITAQLTDCGTVNAEIFTGWNCSAFDPLTHPFCQKTSLDVQAQSNDPLISIIQPTNLGATPFCDTIPVELELKNTQLGRDFNMNIDFTLPPNLVLIPGSVEIAWPKSASFLPLGSDPTYVNSTIYGDNYTFSPFAPYPYLMTNGLPNVSTTSITDSNEITIRYKVISDCGFTSGRSSTLRIFGNKFCGDPTDTTGFTTFPFFVSGSEPDPANKIMLTPILADSINGQFPVTIDITNIGDSLTGPNDKIKVLLSDGFSYVPNSASANGWTPGEPAITVINGITTLEWILPQGMSNGDINSFDFMLSSMDIGCGEADGEIGFTAVREQQQLCATTGSICTVDVITSDLQVKNIHKNGSPIVTIGSSVSDTLCAGLAIDLFALGTTDVTWIAQPSGDTIGVGNPYILTPDLSLTGIIATATADTCSISSDTMNVFVQDAPQLTLPQDTTINEGDTILINGVLTTNIPTSLQWSPTTALSDTTIVNPLAFPEDSTLYILQAIGDNGCTVADSINLFVIPKIDTLPCPIFHISEDSINYLVVCGLDVNFPLSISGDSLANYQVWVDGQLANDSITNNPSPPGNYEITGMNTATGTFNVTWDFKDSIYTSTVNDVAELLNQLNTWDSFGNWFYDENNETIWGGVFYHQYKHLTITNGNGLNLDLAYVPTIDYGQSVIPLAFGAHRIIVFDSLNTCADTVYVDVSCQKYNPHSTTGGCISESIYINQEMTYCIDTTTLPGMIVSLSNICENIDTGAVEYVLNDTTFCLDYKGLSIGSDSACIVICDDLGLCDTINFCTSVVPYTGLPHVNDDSTCVYMNTPGVYDILANDTTWGGIDTIYFVNTPLSGQLTLNLDNTITYVPDYDVCERTDRLQYIVCNGNGCDDAFVDICILCDDIVVFTAVSPNRDGVNDVFYIANIENYPNNVVDIYNRWGNRVFRGTGYANTWGGSWVDNKIVPDGTYYYVIKLNDRAKRVFKGYLEIRR